MKKFNIYEILSFIFVIGGVTFVSLSTFAETRWVFYLELGIILLCCSYIFSVISKEKVRKKLRDIIKGDDDEDDDDDWMNTPTIKVDYKEEL